ncbi:MAG: hypothetical protein ABI451_12975 [Dokdonella sp.]
MSRPDALPPNAVFCTARADSDASAKRESVETLRTLIGISRQGELFFHLLAQTGMPQPLVLVVTRLIDVKAALARELSAQVIDSGEIFPGIPISPAEQHASSRYLQLLRAIDGAVTSSQIDDIDDIEDQFLWRLENVVGRLNSSPVRASLLSYAPQLQACRRDLQRIARTTR